MKLKSMFVIALLFGATCSYGQLKKILVSSVIGLPQDTVLARQLTSSLDNFLIAAQKPNEENSYIFPGERIETFVQLDEVNGMEKSGRFKDDFFYKPYLTNVVPIENNNYLIQVSYIGVNENTPLLVGSFEFIAHRKDDTFLFSSPLVRNTRNWKTTVVSNNTFHYQATINQAKLNEFDKLASMFDKKLKATNKKCEFYLCEDFVELLKLIGVDYKSRYNGMSKNNLASSLGDKRLVVLGNNSATFNDFDPHDLWHDRLSLVIARSKVNKPLDEGYAYLYGGSWGITWTEILKQFKEKIASDKNTDWVAIKENPVTFGDSQRPIHADYVVSALLLKKIEKEKGFDGVWEFLNCGPYEQGNENFYRSLEKLTGITKASYNNNVWELIAKEK